MSAREMRRLALARRQLTLARIDRREALGGLAASLAEEARSRALAQRSRAMATDYTARRGGGAGEELAGRLRFAGSLARLAGDAEASGFEAAREAGAQAHALAATERRLERLETREAEARRAREAARETRAAESAGGMARKLQSRS